MGRPGGERHPMVTESLDFGELTRDRRMRIPFSGADVITNPHAQAPNL